ncbi:MAG: gamma carbonic anhydrase family protein [Rubrivivax sp.]
MDMRRGRRRHAKLRNRHLTVEETRFLTVVHSEGCFIGPQATLRGDNHGPIRLEAMSNVQDNCVVHACPGGTVVLHRCAQVGHGAVLHGCTLMENCLVGIHATVLDGAVLGTASLPAAQALVVSGVRTESGSLYACSPARFVRSLSRDAIAALRESALRAVA